MEKYDIVIVGGGLAGLSTALQASRKVDKDVLLIDKGFIGDPTKTSPFTFPDIVERFGLSDAVLQKYTRFTYRSPTGVAASYEFENPAFVTLDYHKTCSIALERIRKEGNTEVAENTEAIGLEVDTYTNTLKLSFSDFTDVSCNVLVDASGKSFFVSGKLGLPRARLYSHPYGEFLEGCRIEDPKEMCIFAGNKYGNGGGWLYPVDETRARFGFATVTRSHVFPRDIVQRNFREAILNFNPYNRMLAETKRRRSEFGTIPIGPLKKLVYGQILIVGDAAAQATPWYNEGIRPAMESGEMCGSIIAKAYGKGMLNKATLKEYQHVWDAKNRETYAEGTRARFESNSRTQKQWDDSVNHHASLTPAEMITKIRCDEWPASRLSKRSWYTRSLRNLLSRL